MYELIYSSLSPCDVDQRCPIDFMIEMFSSVLSNTVAPSHMWLVSPWTAASTTEEMNSYSHFILITLNLHLNEHKGLVTIQSNHTEVFFFF